jgi:two-component system phosphate regulon sensor histidine kinase PhoR
LTKDDIGKHIQDVVNHIRYSSLIDNANEVMLTGNVLEKEIQTTDKKWYQMNILPYFVRKENKTNGVIITFVDITMRVITVKEMAKLNKGYETFIYEVVHDIK